MASAFTDYDLEKVAAASFNLDVGDLLLLETNNLNNEVLVGSKRALYFSTRTSKVLQTFSFFGRDTVSLSFSFCHTITVIDLFFSRIDLDSSIIRMDVAGKIAGPNEERVSRTNFVQPRRGKQKKISS